jgi:hypothetical protein
MNAQKHERLGVSPAEIVFGNAARLQRGFVIPVDEQTRKSIEDSISTDIAGEGFDSPTNTREWTVQQYMAKLLFAQKRIIALSQQSQRKFDQQHMEEEMHHKLLHSADGDQKVARYTRTLTSFPLYSYVLALHHAGAMGNRPKTKLQTLWRGPFQVVERDGSIYTVWNMVTNRNKRHHVKNLKPFYYDLNDPGAPRRAALMDERAADVDTVLRHMCKGETNKARNYQFLIRFVDNDEKWLPWSVLKKNEKVHEYLAANKLKSLIPKGYK